MRISEAAHVMKMHLRDAHLGKRNEKVAEIFLRKTTCFLHLQCAEQRNEDAHGVPIHEKKSSIQESTKLLIPAPITAD